MPRRGTYLDDLCCVPRTLPGNTPLRCAHFLHATPHSPHPPPLRISLGAKKVNKAAFAAAETRAKKMEEQAAAQSVEPEAAEETLAGRLSYKEKGVEKMDAVRLLRAAAAGACAAWRRRKRCHQIYSASHFLSHRCPLALPLSLGRRRASRRSDSAWAWAWAAWAWAGRPTSTRTRRDRQ